MAKVAGAYESVVRGVSEQIAQDRRSGQHEEQVNFLSDPVRGLARRHGSIMQDEQLVGSTDLQALLADTVRHQTFTFYVDKVEYDLVYRTTASSRGQTGFAFAFNKQTNRFIPIVYASGDSTLDTLISGGVSSITNVGKYILLAGNTIIPTWTPTASWDDASNQSQAAVWVRGGAYSRTFSITVTLNDGSAVVASYKTKSVRRQHQWHRFEVVI